MSEKNVPAFPVGVELNLSAYYYSFENTGCYEIDLILAAVAAAGKSYHHTDSWYDETPAWRPGVIGDCPINWIQNAANNAAAMLAARSGKGEA